MTKQAINNTIAQLCGFTDIIFRGLMDPKDLDYVGHHRDRDSGFQYKVPNYCDDLEAMFEAEKHLTVPHYVYLNKLREVCSRRCEKNKVGQPLVSDWHVVHSTSAERAEAVLRAEGKWVE